MRNLTIAVFALFLVSCSQSKMLQSNLRKYSSSMGYLHDSPASGCPRTNQVYLNINSFPLDTVTTVSKSSSLVLPFIIFNHFETTMKVKLGQSSILEDYTNFFTGALTDESKRSGCFSIAGNKTNDSIYTLDLSIDSCKTTSKYRKSFTFWFLVVAYGWNMSESGSLAQTDLLVSAKLRKGSSLIYEKKYNINRIQPFVNPTRGNTNQLLSDFTANMVEALSLSTKECIDQIVSDLNTSFYGSARPAMKVDNAAQNTSTAPEIKPDTAKTTQAAVAEQKPVTKTESGKNQLQVGDKIKFYNYGFNDYIKGVVKEINGDTIVVEYESFGKLKTEKVTKSEIKRY